MSLSKNIPVFILAGGLGTRLSEETGLKPKPMVEIGNTPILIHLMRWYYQFGFSDFVICGGYRSWEIKDYFLNYNFRMNHLEIDHRKDPSSSALIYQGSSQEKWRVRVLDTGLEAMTGARLARALDIVSESQDFSDFAVTYGDGLANVLLNEELSFHLEHGRIGTVLAVNNPQRFGILNIEEESIVRGFVEKPKDRHDIINGGFFFFKKIFRTFLDSKDSCILEKTPLEKLANCNQLRAFRHTDFWQPMDTLRDKNMLEKLWKDDEAPWRPTPLLPKNGDKNEVNTQAFI